MLLAGPNVTTEAIYKILDAWHAILPSLTDAGASTVYFAFPGHVFAIHPATFPGKTKAEVQVLLQPFLDTITALGISPTLEITDFPHFFEHYFHYVGPFPYGTIDTSQVTGGRFIPRSVFEHNLTTLTSVARSIIERPGSAFSFGGFTAAPTHAAAGNKPADNAVLPAWRGSLLSAMVIGHWNYSTPLATNLATQAAMRDVIEPALEELSPGGGSYLNEANFESPRWASNFYGEKYEKLKTIKAKYDPQHLSYARIAVGSDEWVVDDEGRLCSVDSME